MLATSIYAVQEFVSGIPVVQQTPFFFGDTITLLYITRCILWMSIVIGKLFV